MIPLKLKMGTAIVGMSEDKAVTWSQLQKVQALKHKLEHNERCLAIELAARSDFSMSTMG